MTDILSHLSPPKGTAESKAKGHRSIRVLSNFPLLLHEQMVVNGLTDAELAELCGFHFTTIYGWLKGRFSPSEASMMTLCRVLNIDPRRFCGSYYNGGNFTDKPRRPRSRGRKTAEGIQDRQAIAREAVKQTTNHTPPKAADPKAGDWRLVEVSTNQISTVTMLHLDLASGVAVLTIED